MSKTELITGDFSYGSLDEETAAKLQYFASSGKALIRKSQIQFIADFGKILSEARDELSNHKNGTFIKWATAEFDFSARTVWNYVNAWDRILCNGCTIYLNWSATALYLLADSEIPKPVQKKLEQIPSTDFVRVSYVKRLIEANTPKPEPPPETVKTTSESDDAPFDAVPAPTLTAAEVKAAKEEARAAEREAAREAKAAEKAAAKAARAAEKAAAKEAAAKAKEAAKVAAKAAREKAKADAKAAKVAALPIGEQIKLTRDLAQQLIHKAVNAVDDLSLLKKSPNLSANEAEEILKLVNILRGKSRHMVSVKLLQHIGKLLW